MSGKLDQLPLPPNHSTRDQVHGWVASLYPRFTRFTDKQIHKGEAEALCTSLLHVLLTQDSVDDAAENPILNEMASYLAGLDSEPTNLYSWHRLMDAYAEFMAEYRRRRPVWFRDS
jgi:hypothetical protein